MPRLEEYDESIYDVPRPEAGQGVAWMDIAGNQGVNATRMATTNGTSQLDQVARPAPIVGNVMRPPIARATDAENARMAEMQGRSGPLSMQRAYQQKQTNAEQMAREAKDFEKQQVLLGIKAGEGRATIQNAGKLDVATINNEAKERISAGNNKRAELLGKMKSGDEANKMETLKEIAGINMQGAIDKAIINGADVIQAATISAQASLDNGEIKTVADVIDNYADAEAKITETLNESGRNAQIPEKIKELREERNKMMEKVRETKGTVSPTSRGNVDGAQPKAAAIKTSYSVGGKNYPVPDRATYLKASEYVDDEEKFGQLSPEEQEQVLAGVYAFEAQRDEKRRQIKEQFKNKSK